MRTARAPGKINLALVVGPRRSDGKHEVVTVYQRVDLADEISLGPSDGLRLTGFDADTLVTTALHHLAAAAGVQPFWHVHIEKAVPVAAGLGGGSSDAAAALKLANETLDRPLQPGDLAALAASIGADVPFFLAPGPQLGAADGTELAPLDLPLGYWVVLVRPRGAEKGSTAAVYEAFDRRGGGAGFGRRRAALVAAVATVRQPRDLAGLPLNDLASSPHAAELEQLGAFRADVTGAGPTVYGLFEDAADAGLAAERIRALGEVWVTRPTWYG